MSADALGFLVAVLGLYFVPAIIAIARKHPNAVAIFALDLLGGWTFVGWLVALVWSLTAIKRAD